jgi:hypothetical protein
MSYILRAKDKEGTTMFYTGKAGMEWLSLYESNAFGYPTRELAQERAKRFNRMEPVHGYWFLALPTLNTTRMEDA